MVYRLLLVHMYQIEFQMLTDNRSQYFIVSTVIPRFTRLPWQPKNRVNQNCPYRSHSIDKKLSKKCQKNFY